MQAVHLEAGRLRLSVLPDVGAGIADFSIKGPSGYFFPIMRRAAPGESNASLLGSFFMAPWCNRIAGAKFTFQGRERVLAANTADGMAQHGDVRKRAWTVLDRGDDFVELGLDSRACADVNWPWAFACRAVFRLSGDARGGELRIDLSVENTEGRPWPAGCGHHPYFMRRLWDDADELHVLAPVTGRYALDRGCATGPAAPDLLSRMLGASSPVPAEPVDAVFGGFGGQAELFWPRSGVRLTVQTSKNLGHLVYYAPHARPAEGSSPLSFVAVEPQSQVNNALNLEGQSGVGTVILQPGERLETTCRFKVVAN